ncbi:delta(7)-sterol 5(6)-desaturase erg32 isoform X1 [Strongylocentrotus purpuratus]|uniref:Fatty acid hydroxylase domain-containing protein n=1 Tax=Strongylocentrotus purpuratus TaxID=7668 RepID=A0A7M7NE94_STRPU|nr:delta(7)-sterol 5(6)-desaturase erg32 isoform X1 [Strongylocentrotus purpuratus]
MMAKQGRIGKLGSLLTRIRRAILAGLGTLLTALLATGLRGDWLLMYVQIKRLWQEDTTWRTIPSQHTSFDIDNVTNHEFVGFGGYYMKDVGFYVLQSFTGAFLIFYGVGGYLKWYYYIQRRERAADWKCQPDRFLQPEDDRLEFWLGSLNIAIGSLSFGILVTYIMNGGETKLYYSIKDYGWVYFLLSIPGLYVYNEASSYYTHRLMHHPILYRRYHKLHHHFKAPTPWTAAASHPYEFIIFQFLLEIPIFLVPLHAGVFLCCLIYGYYHSIISHSGIDLHSMFPWQPSVIFHDDHHKYFHCNFGVNTMIFDRLHGTLRKNNRFYSETTFGGKGAPIQEPSAARVTDKYS